jgi:hypothetical protein
LTLNLLNLCQSAFSEHAHGAEKFTDGLIGEAVDYKQPLFFGLHQASGSENLQVLGGIGHGQARLLRQNLDRALPLAEEV